MTKIDKQKGIRGSVLRDIEIAPTQMINATKGSKGIDGLTL
jgi:hypothetical protein